MTIGGWIVFAIIAFTLACIGSVILLDCDTKTGRAVTVIVTLALITAANVGMHWYYNNTESGKRAIVNQKSEFGGGLERTINIYTADGEIMRTFTGKIDIENKDGGYLLFDYNGKRYTYYNCFVESVAYIE